MFKSLVKLRLAAVLVAVLGVLACVWAHVAAGEGVTSRC